MKMSVADLDQYNEDELNAPEWMNDDFFLKVLKQQDPASDIKLKNVEITPASMKGDHFASIMFRASVTFIKNKKEVTISLIIKTMPDTECVKTDLLQDSFIFETEADMYGNILPKYEETLHAAGDDTQFGPRCLYHTLKPKKVLVFEDLLPLGYDVVRDRPLNMEEVKAAFLKLSKMHALSFKILKENPQMLKGFCHSFFSMPDIKDNAMNKNAMPNFLAMLDSVPKLQQFKPYFDKIKDDYFEKCAAGESEYFINRDENVYYVLCHGDFHGKNMMFKRNAESGKVEDVKLIDFQVSHINPMVNDLLYAKHLILDDNKMKNDFDELLYFYYINLIETLKKCGFEGPLPELVELRRQIMRQKYFELYLLITIRPMFNCWTGQGEKLDLNSAMSDMNYSKIFYKNETYIDVVYLFLKKYLHEGYFEDF